MKQISALLCAIVLCMSASFASPPPQKNNPKPKAAAQQQLVAAATTGHSVTLTWTQGTVPTGATCPSGTGSTAITSNNVYRATATGGEGTTPYATVSPAATTYTDTGGTAGLTPGTTYFYQITATNCGGESAHSNEASGLIPNPVAPNAPTGVTATAQ